MKTATITIEGISPYSQSQFVLGNPKLKDETHDEYEQRIWEERLHRDAHGYYIPPMALKKAITAAASFLGIQIKGKGKKTYTKHFQCGLLITEPAYLKSDPPQPEMLMMDAQPGKAKLGSGGTRVPRVYPRFADGWTATFNCIIVSEEISRDIFMEHVDAAGKFIGIGRFRPENGGFYGRFVVKNAKWSAE